MVISALVTMISQLIYFSKPYIFRNWANHIFSAWYEFSFTLLYIIKCYESYFLTVCKAIWNLLMTDTIYPNNYSAPFIAESSPVHQGRVIWWHVEWLRKRSHFFSVSAHTKLTDATKHFQWFSPPGKWRKVCLDLNRCVCRSRKTLCFWCEQTGAWESLCNFLFLLLQNNSSQ